MCREDRWEERHKETLFNGRRARAAEKEQRAQTCLYIHERGKAQIALFFTFKLPVRSSFTVDSRQCPLSQNYFKDSAVIPEIILVFQNQMRDVRQRGQSAAITHVCLSEEEKKTNSKTTTRVRILLVAAVIPQTTSALLTKGHS